MKKRLLYTLIFIFFLTVVSIAYLEIISRNTCSQFNFSGWTNPCNELEKSSEKPAPEDFSTALPNKDSNLGYVLNNLTIEVNRDRISGLNGITCQHHIYVAADLPYFAKKYVKTHEGIHLLGNHNETQTTFQAALKEPLGLIDTIRYSVIYNLTNQGNSQRSLQRRIGGMWNIFKRYFLNL